MREGVYNQNNSNFNNDVGKKSFKGREFANNNLNKKNKLFVLSKIRLILIILIFIIWMIIFISFIFILLEAYVFENDSGGSDLLENSNVIENNNIESPVIENSPEEIIEVSEEVILEQCINRILIGPVCDDIFNKSDIISKCNSLGLLSDECYYGAAIIKNNVEYCDNIGIEGFKVSCRNDLELVI